MRCQRLDMDITDLKSVLKMSICVEAGADPSRRCSSLQTKQGHYKSKLK